MPFLSELTIKKNESTWITFVSHGSNKKDSLEGNRSRLKMSKKRNSFVFSIPVVTYYPIYLLCHLSIAEKQIEMCLTLIELPMRFVMI